MAINAPTPMDFEENIKRLQAAQGDPQKLALVTVDIVMTLHSPDLRAALEAAAVPHWFDARILGALLETDGATANYLLNELSGLPMVETFATRRALNVHEASRKALRNMLARESPQRFQALSLRAADTFSGKEPTFQVEAVYHRLLADPTAASDELETLWRRWNKAGRHEALQALGLTLEELLGTDHLTPTARARALLRFGSIQGVLLPLQTREHLASEALRLFRELGDSSGEFDTRDQLGDIFISEGRLPDALREFRAFQQNAKQLIESDPESADWQRELSVSHNRVGFVLQAQGQLTAALAEYKAYQKIMRRLTKCDPENADWKCGLAISHNRVGSVREAGGQLAAALAQYQAYNEIMQGLTEGDPENTYWQRELAVSHYNVGSVLQTRGKLVEALADYQAYHEIMRRLTELDPENTSWQRELSISHYSIGAVLEEQGELAGALAEYQAHKEIMLRLTERDPENTGWQRELSVSHYNVGSMLLAQGQLEAALREGEADLRIAESLAELDPSNIQWQEDLAVTQESVNLLRQELKKRS